MQLQQSEVTIYSSSGRLVIDSAVPYFRDMEPMGGIDGFVDTINLYTPDAVDTMSSMLQWAVLYLAYFPDVQKRLQLHIDEVRQSLNKCLRLAPNKIF